MALWPYVEGLKEHKKAHIYMGHDAHDKNIHTRPKVGSCVYALMIIENLGHKTTIKTFWHLKPFVVEGLRASTATLLNLDGSRVSFLHLIVLVCLFEYYVMKVVLLQNPMLPKG